MGVLRLMKLLMPPPRSVEPGLASSWFRCTACRKFFSGLTTWEETRGVRTQPGKGKGGEGHHPLTLLAGEGDGGGVWFAEFLSPKGERVPAFGCSPLHRLPIACL